MTPQRNIICGLQQCLGSWNTNASFGLVPQHKYGVVLHTLAIVSFLFRTLNLELYIQNLLSTLVEEWVRKQCLSSHHLKFNLFSKN